MTTEFHVNGSPHALEVAPRRRLLDVLREDLELTGTKEGCGEGECGSCTVLIDGRPTCSCLVPAVQVHGRSITTIEGLGAEEGRRGGDGLAAVQRALLETGGVQCGACTPGIALTASAVLAGNETADRARWRELLAGNLCRCTGWRKVIDAVRSIRVEAPAARPTARVGPSLAEVLRERAEHPDRALCAGGTDLMVDARDDPARAGLIDLLGVPELGGIELERGTLRIGACTSFAELERSPLVAEYQPLLVSAAREVGAVQIRERATLGGNLVTCSPVSDGLPVLLALDAEIEVASLVGRRRIEIVEFIRGYRLTDLKEGELVVAIRCPLPTLPRIDYWRKVGSRRAQSIAKVSLAAAAHIDGEGRARNVRMAMGAVADRPLRLREVEDRLEGERPDESLASALKALTRESLAPIDDLRSTAAYRSRVAGNLIAGFVRLLSPRPPTAPPRSTETPAPPSPPSLP